MILPAEGFDAKRSLNCVTEYNATHIYGVPTMFLAMLDEYENNPSNYNVESLKGGFISGYNVPESLLKRTIKDFGV